MLCFSIVPTAWASERDVQVEGHWASVQLNKWVSQGLMNGYADGSFQPDRAMTRAEFVKLIDSIFGFNAQSGPSFTDVDPNEWYAESISAAREAGYISGYADGTFRPDEHITREQVGHMVSGLFHLTAGDGQALSSFEDEGRVSEYAREGLASLVANGYMNGYPDHTIRPQQSITRAELVTLLERIVPHIMNEAGVYADLSTDGHVLINTEGVTLQGAAVEGNVFLTAGIGEGDATLEKVSVDGTVFIQGGGQNSVYIKESKLGKVSVNKKDAPVRVVLSGASQVNEMGVESSATLEVDEDSTVEALEIGEGAEGTKVKAEGTIGKVDNKAEGVSINDEPLQKGEEGSVKKGVVTTPTTPASSNTGQPSEDDDPPSNNPDPDPDPQPQNPDTDWTLVWSDEFDGSGTNLDSNGVDLDKWDYQLGTGSQYGLDGWGNNEQQYYRAENAKVADGKLIIEAKNDGYEGKPYTSSRLFTEPTFTKKYGKFEARMKLPVGQGFWPAFWMMPAESIYGGWAASGEIDIMEARGRLPGEVGGTIHYGENWPLNRATGDEYHFEDGTDISDFHTYSVEWEPGVIRWYVDGELYQELNNWDSWGADQPAKYAFPAPFDQEFYMILNLAIGGNYDGGREPDASMFPSTMEVDYVRVYELTGRPYNTPVEPEVLSEPLPDGGKEAVDGNYVHDTGFEQGFTTVDEDGEALDPSYWNFVHVSTFNGGGTASVETIDGSKYAKVDITQAGNAAHAVQLIQNVTLGKGRWYKLSFDAKAEANRTMPVKLGGGADRGWTAYSRTLEAQLSTEIQPYELVFQMEKESDTLARLEFNMGLNTSSIWLGNVKLEETSAPELYPDLPKEPLDGNHVYNGSFDLGRIDRMTFWHFDMNGADAEASVNPNTRELKIAVSDGGSAADAVKLVQPGMNLIGGNEYEISFKARADEARTVQVAVLSKDGLTEYAAPQSVDVGTSMETKIATFDMEAANDLEGQLVFLLGGSEADVYLDDVVLLRLTDNNIGGLPLEEQFPLKNGDFSDGTVAWSEHVQGRWDGWDNVTKFSAVDGELKFHVSSVGNDPWDVILMQTDFPLKQGNTYVVTLDARSTQDRPVEIVVDANNERYVSEMVNLTSTTQTFSYELPVTDDLTASFKLLIGNVEGVAVDGAHDVFVDNVRVELKDAREKAFLLSNGDFSEGLTGWDTHYQGQYDGESVASFSADNGAVKTTIEHTGANPWDILVAQTGKSLEKEQTYIVSFVARSTTPRVIEAIVENADYTRFLNEQVELADTTKAYSFEFTMESEQVAGLKFLMGKMEGETLGTHDIFIDNVRFELKGALEATGEKLAAGNDILLPAPPVLTPDAASNVLGEPITIEFADSEAWRTAITEISMDGVTVADTGYTISEGAITLDASHFGAAKDYVITVKASGFELAQLTQPVEAESLWTLVWNDEFSGTGSNLDTNGVDLSKWGYQNGTGAEFGLVGWGNNEQQYYQKENINVADGKLVIEAKQEAVGGKPYTSGRLWTSPTFTKKYGKFEARIKLPEGQGFWPAFWMMPKDQMYGGWAASGEIDIVEARGRVPEQTDGTIHYGKGWPNNKATGDHYVFPEGQSITDFHTYTVEWEPGELRWYVDGNLFQTINDWYSWGVGEPEKYAYPAPFDQEFYMIMNLAVGGNYDGGVVPEVSDFPAQMEVDYVRVYELTGREYMEPVEPVIEKEPIPDEARDAVDGNFVYDPNYEEGFHVVAANTENSELDANQWNVVTGTGGAGSATVETVNGAEFAKMTVANGGSNDYSVQLIQLEPIVKGHYYKVSFNAMSTTARNLIVKVSGGADRGWGAYSDTYSASLTEDVQTYSFVFQMSSETDLAARLEFNMGLNTNPVWIGNVKVELTDSLLDPNAKKAPLDNGNHVYNGGFDQGTMERMAFWDFAVNGAEAEAFVDADTRQLNVEMTNGGALTSAIELMQKGLNLLQTDSYTFSFDAKAAAVRTIEVALLSKDGSVDYVNETIHLTEAMEEHFFSFTMPLGVTDEEAQLVFRLGGSTEAVVLDHVKLIRTTNNNVDYTDVDMYPLKNGDFGLGLEGWEPFVQGGAATFTGADGEAKVNITNVGGEAWNVMLNQGGMSLKKGFEYVISFDASSTVARDIEVALENAAYTRRFQTGPIQVTPDTKHYSYSFMMSVDDVLALKFILGKTAASPSSAHDVVIDNVVLEIKDAPVKRPPTLAQDKSDARVGQPIELPFVADAEWTDAIESVIVDDVVLAVDQYTVQADRIVLAADVFPADSIYTVTIVAEGYADVSVSQQVFPSDGNIVLNGGFSNGDASWSYWNEAADWSNWAVENGVAKINIHYDGGTHAEWAVPFSWSTQLIQEGIQIEAGKTYELSFKAWSSIDRSMEVELNGYSGDKKVRFAITDDDQAVYTASIVGGAGLTLKLVYLLGNVDGTSSGEHVVWIDDVIIKEVVAAPALTADSTENKIGQSMEITFPDNPDWRSAITTVQVDGSTLEASKYTIEAGKLTVDTSVFPTIKSYTLTISAEGYGDTTVAQAVKTAAESIALNKTASASSNNQPAGGAFDGNAGTRWESEHSDDEWISVYLGGVYELDSVVLDWEGAYGKAYKIQVSTAMSPTEDDWNDVFTEDDSDGGVDEITLAKEEARHVRMLGVTRALPYGYSLWEFQVFGTLVDELDPVAATEVFYLLDEGQLSLTAGTGAMADQLPQDQTHVEYVTVTGAVYGTYNGTGVSTAQLFVNGLAVGLQVTGEVSYDFDGDGEWDWIETIDMMPTNGDTAPGSYEVFDRELSSTDAFEDFVGGSIKVTLYLQSGNDDGEVKVSAPAAEASKIVIPYDLE